MSTTCVDGCAVGACFCYSPWFTCNTSGGECAGFCTGSCDMSPLLIGLIAGACGLVVLCCIIACCGKSIRAALCPRRDVGPVYVQMQASGGTRPLVYEDGLSPLPPSTSTPRFCTSCGAKRVAGMACASCGAT